MSRPSWNKYFVDITELVKTRTTCTRRAVGAIIVNDEHQILGSGYNGAPAGVTHCEDMPDGCLRAAQNIPSGQRHEICRGIHAEQNAVIQAGAERTHGATMYTTTFPCSICAKIIINARIKRIYYWGAYADPLSEPMFIEAGIDLCKLDPTTGNATQE